MTMTIYPIGLKVEPKTKADEVALQSALAELVSRDFEARFWKDAESGELFIEGQSEVHLDGIIDKLINEYHVGLTVGAPQISYREVPIRAAEVEHTYEKRSQTIWQFAHVRLRLEPIAIGENNEFRCELSETLALPLITAAKTGVQRVWDNGVRIGFPMFATRVTLTEATVEEGAQSAAALEVAAYAAMQTACHETGIKLLEPVMDVEIVVPADYTGPVLADLLGRRGQMCSQAPRGANTIFHAHVPLAEMFGYVSVLRSITQGRGTHTKRFSHYAAVEPRSGPESFPPAVGKRA